MISEINENQKEIMFKLWEKSRNPEGQTRDQIQFCAVVLLQEEVCRKRNEE